MLRLSKVGRFIKNASDSIKGLIMAENAFVKITIQAILDSLKQPIPFIQPLYEIIANSLEAKATNILVEFDVDETQQIIKSNDADNAEMSVKEQENKRKICGFKTTDDGEGFTPKNINSFLEFKSETKKHLGCKGVGRFTWLKVFEKIRIESHTGKTKIEFDFSSGFAIDNIKPILETNQESKTVITFADVTTLYKKFANSNDKRTKDIDERLTADINKIKRLVEEQLLVKLFLLHKEGSRFEIKLRLKDTEVVISNDTITKLQEKEFKILDTLDNSLDPKYYNFTLYYAFEQNTDKQPVQSYCAAGRLVAPFTETVQIKNLQDNHTLTMLLTSEYFDERTTEERNDLTFNRNDVNRTFTNPISMSEINEKMRSIVDDILLEKFPNLNNDNDKIVNESKEEYPYLAKYIKQDDSKIKNKEKIIAYATKEYEKEKRQVKSDFTRMLEIRHTLIKKCL